MIKVSNTIEKNVCGYLENIGLKPLSKDYYQHIYGWVNWYKGQVDDFHKYTMYNGFQFIDKKRATLNMPKRVGEEWASILFNDKVNINVDDNDGKFSKVLQNNHFDHKFSELLERTFTLGTGATVVYKDNKGEPRINYILAPMIFPLREDNGEIIDCAFASVVGDAYYINIHERNDLTGIYTIQNKRFKITGNNRYAEEKMTSVLESYSSTVKMFQIYKPNIANNLDLFTPFGLSVFSNAIDQNKTIDLIYDSFKNEFDLGKKKLCLSVDTLTYKTVVGIDKEGNSATQEIPIFDREQTEFFALPGDGEGGKGTGPIMEINPVLRVTEHIDALQTALNLFADSCGLGPDRFIFRDGKVYTNSDQVISTQSKLYKNIVNHEKMLQYSMVELVKAIFYVINGSEYTKDVTIDFDDSIIEDSEKTRQQALLELNNGLIDDIQYYMVVYKMTEDQAIKFRDKIKKRSPQEEVDEEPPTEE